MPSRANLAVPSRLPAALPRRLAVYQQQRCAIEAGSFAPGSRLPPSREQAIALGARLLLDPGDEVLVEDPGYPGIRANLTRRRPGPHRPAAAPGAALIGADSAGRIARHPAALHRQPRMPQAGPALCTLPLYRAPWRSPRAWAPMLAAGCLLLAGLPVLAQGKAAPAARAKAPAAATKPANSRQKLDNQAKGLALATATTEAISAHQLDIAGRVLTGTADCEFKQTVQVLAGKPGLFTVTHKGKRFVMAPRETSTGAVRLEDPAAGVVWLQIPAKSMLLNARIGQRMVDSCQHSEQRAATLAVAGAAQTLGIEARAAADLPEAAASAVPAAPASAEVAASAASR